MEIEPLKRQFLCTSCFLTKKIELKVLSHKGRPICKGCQARIDENKQRMRNAG